MHTRINIAMTSLAALWIVTGIVFGGLSFVGTTPQAHALVHSVDCGPQRTLRVECEPHAQTMVSAAAPRI